MRFSGSRVQIPPPPRDTLDTDVPGTKLLRRIGRLWGRAKTETEAPETPPDPTNLALWPHAYTEYIGGKQNICRIHFVNGAVFVGECAHPGGDDRRRPEPHGKGNLEKRDNGEYVEINGKPLVDVTWENGRLVA